MKTFILGTLFILALVLICGSAGAWASDSIGFTQCCVQCGIGFGLLAIVAKCSNAYDE